MGKLYLTFCQNETVQFIRHFQAVGHEMSKRENENLFNERKAFIATFY